MYKFRALETDITVYGENQAKICVDLPKELYTNTEKARYINDRSKIVAKYLFDEGFFSQDNRGGSYHIIASHR